LPVNPFLWCNILSPKEKAGTKSPLLSQNPAITSNSSDTDDNSSIYAEAERLFSAVVAVVRL